MTGKIKNIAKRHQILFAYLFGSWAKDVASVLSDLDLAVYCSPKFSKTDRDKIVCDFRDEIEKQLKMPQKVDIVCLNEELPFLLIKDIVYEGKIIYCCDELERINWESKALSLWMDWEYYQRQYDEAILTQPRI